MLLASPLALIFSITAIMELADKTMVATVLYAIKSKNVCRVFFVSVFAFLTANIVPAILADKLSYLVESRGWVELVAGIVFVLAGVESLKVEGYEGGLGGGSLFLGVFLAEMGDKTQLSVISFSTLYGWPAAILGATSAYALVNGVAVALSYKAVKKLEGWKDRVGKISGILLIILGVAISSHGVYLLAG